MWKIGNVEIDNQIVLAPMAGVSNSAFRRIAKDMGTGLIVCEMVSDKAIYYKNKKTIDMLYMKDSERPIAQQIFGSDKQSFVYAAKYIEKTMKPDIIDINMGCPVPKVSIKAQAGSALLKDLDKVYDIVASVVGAVKIPVTVKIRSGWDSNNAVDIAKVIEKAGASAITIHPRTRAQGYTGKANWDIIKQVKENVKIPVIGNGDIKTKYDALRMLNETKCDAVMIGRATLGNPWLLKECVDYLNHQNTKEITTLDKIKMIKKHLDYLLEFKDEHLALLEMRTHTAWYLKGIPNSTSYKTQFMQTKTKEEFLTLLTNLKNEVGK
ncbi:MAG: tRNA dihydrouridine synthase DusB [Bacilli bacterium]